MAVQGTSVVNFGAFPGSSDTSFTVTSQAGITSSSLVEAWMWPVATSDHSADEHWVETIQVVAGNIVPATSFTIYARNTNQVATQTPVPSDASPLLYGQWNVAWVWN